MDILIILYFANIEEDTKTKPAPKKIKNEIYPDRANQKLIIILDVIYSCVR